MVDDFQPRSDRRIGRDDRLGHGRRDLARSPGVPDGSPQLSEVHARVEIERSEAVHDDAAGGAGVARGRSPTRITARRGASRSRDLRIASRAGSSIASIAARRLVRRFDHHDSEVRAVPRDMRSRFTIDGPQLQLQPHRSGERRREIAAAGTIDLAHWPEQTYQITSSDRLPDAEEHLLPRRARSTRRATADFDGHVSPFSGGRELKGTSTARWRA